MPGSMRAGERRPGVAAPMMAAMTSAGGASGCAPRYTAATPATWGTAMEVPEAHA